MPQAKPQIDNGVIQRLQQQLTNAFLLYANYKKQRWSADLIVVGSHWRGAVGRFFPGSVSLAVAAHAACSVEIAR